MTTENRVTIESPAKIGEKVAVGHGRYNHTAKVVEVYSHGYTVECQCGTRLNLPMNGGYRRVE